MPAKRRIPRKRRKSMFTTHHLQQLRTGHDHGSAFGGGAFGDGRDGLQLGSRGLGDAKAAWQIFRDEILHDWIREQGPHYRPQGPGTRPWAWWAFDAPEPRRRIDGGIHPHDDPARHAHVAAWDARHPGFARRAGKLYFGLPSCLMRGEGFDDFSAEYEAEFQYIDRLGLWLPGELAMGVPLLAAAIAKHRAALQGEREPSEQDLARLRVLDADLVRLTAKLEAQS